MTQRFNCFSKFSYKRRRPKFLCKLVNFLYSHSDFFLVAAFLLATAMWLYRTPFLFVMEPCIVQFVNSFHFFLIRGGSTQQNFGRPFSSRSNFLHFHADLGKVWPNNRLVSPFRVGAPRKSWIHH